MGQTRAKNTHKMRKNAKKRTIKKHTKVEEGKDKGETKRIVILKKFRVK